MPVLSNKTFSGPHTLNVGRSFGPFISIDEDNFRFDTQICQFPIWLGHLPSPMFGVLQHLESWDAEWTEEMLRIKDAYLRLLERTKDGLCGKLHLFPLVPPKSDVYTSSALKPAAMIYQYIAVSILDQYSDTHQAISDSIEANAKKLIEKCKPHLFDPFINGPNFEFGFEFKDAKTADLFRMALPKAGIMNKPIASNWALPKRWPDQPCAKNPGSSFLASNRFIFQLNLAFRDSWLDLFWERMNLVFDNFQNVDAKYEPVELGETPETSSIFEFHRGLNKAKSNKKAPRAFAPKKYLETVLESRSPELTPVIVTKKNFKKFRDRILEMQIEIYEPARRTPPEEFEMLFDSDNPLAIIVLNDEKIAAMVFAGRLGLFTEERGVSSDPFVDDPTVYYSMDLTVAPEYRGGLGRLMKQALVMLAINNGVSAIHGRNRDRLAAGMWAINLSLGSYELQHLPDDYPDDEKYRDCIYYRCPLEWSQKLTRHKLKKLWFRGMVEGLNVQTTTLLDN